MRPLAGTSSMLDMSAAGFIATNTLGSSPAVKTSRLEKLIWKPLTPAKVPAGARISAGKSGSVAISLPASADSAVNCIPASCMPSPESPQKRTTTLSPNCERAEFIETPAPFLGDFGHMRARRPAMRPRREHLEISPSALRDYLHGTVRAIARPTPESEPIRLVRSGAAKEHALHAAR